MQPSQSNNNIKTTIIQNIHTYATYRIYTKQQSTTIQCTHMQCNTNIRTHIHIYIHIQLRKTAQINNTYRLLHIPSNSHNIQPPQSTTVWKNTISTTKYRTKNPPPHNKKHNLTQNTAHRVTSRHHHYHTHAHNKTKQ